MSQSNNKAEYFWTFQLNFKNQKNIDQKYYVIYYHNIIITYYIIPLDNIVLTIFFFWSISNSLFQLYQILIFFD